MKRQDSILAALATVGAGLALFQYWAAYALSDGEAFEVLRFCSLSEALDCYTAIHVHGKTLAAFGIRVIPLLLVLFLLQLALFGWAKLPREERGASLAAWARALTLPTAGLCVYAVLNTYYVTREYAERGEISAHAQSSVSALLLMASAVSGAVLTFTQRRRAHGRLSVTGVPFLLGAALAVVFLQGASGARLRTHSLEAELASAAPRVLFPTFARSVPRRGAAKLGNPAARSEVLFVFDPAHANSREALDRLLRRVGSLKSKLRLLVYATGPHAAGLAVAQEAGIAPSYLKALARGEEEAPALLTRLGADAAKLDDPELHAVIERQARRLEAGI